MRGTIVRLLKPYDAVAVENPAFPGTPDVNYIEGWIELKWLRNWPVKRDSIVKFEHYTQQQKLWMRQRHLKGGKVGLLLQCKKEWLYFTYPQLMDVGKLSKQKLIETAKFHTVLGMNGERIKEWLNLK